MAKIVPSELAPDAAVHYSFAEGEFDLGPGQSYETDDRAVIGGAETHPWLSVEVDPATFVQPVFREPSVRPEDDVLSAVGPNAGVAFDPERIAEDNERNAASSASPTAIEAGQDQGEEAVSGGVATSLASVDTDTSDEVPANVPDSDVRTERPIFSTPTDEDTN